MAKRKLILVVDDDPNLITFFKDFFNKEGYTSVCTEDPEQAVRTANLVHPDLLIIDVLMPKIDGFGVLAEVRKHTPEIRTIVISAYLEKVQDQLKAANVQAVLTKPVPFEELERWVLKLLDVPKEELTEKVAPGARPDIHILYVDDEEEITNWVGSFFNEYGFKMDVANSGEEGLERAKEKQYDILITDNSMGLMPGHEMLRRIKLESQCKPLVIAVSSANLDSGLREKYISLGVSKFIDKPFRLDDLINWLDSQIPVIVQKRNATRPPA